MDLLTKEKERTRVFGGKNFEFLQWAYQHRDVLSGVGMEGGSRSGKTWDSATFCAWYILHHRGKVITVARDKLATLKETTYATFKKVFASFNLPTSQFNKSATDIEINANLIRWIGINDDIFRAHGLEQHLLFVNEAMNIGKDSFDQMEQRTEDFWFIDYNPSAEESWCYDLEMRPDYRMLKTNLLDNPYAPEKQRRKILSYEPTPENIEMGTADEYKWKVYGLGVRAMPEDAVFQKWEIYTEEPEEFDDVYYGLDWGYTADPLALVRVGRLGHRLYIRQLIYETEMGNADLAQRIEEIAKEQYPDILDGYIVCDSSEPKSIYELRSMNVNAIEAEKGAGSVWEGIKALKKFAIFVYAESTDLHDEFRKYKWKKLNDGQLAKNSYSQPIPIDAFNHGIDATRYAVTKWRA